MTVMNQTGIPYDELATHAEPFQIFVPEQTGLMPTRTKYRLIHVSLFSVILKGQRT